MSVKIFDEIISPVARDIDGTNLMVLNGKQNEAVRILLQKWLIDLRLLDCGCHCWRYCGRDCFVFLDLLDSIKLGQLDWDRFNDSWRVNWDVLFAYNLKVKLLGWRVTHLEAVNASGSLQ